MARVEHGGPVHIATGLPGVLLFKEQRTIHRYRVWHESWYAFCVVSDGLGEVRYRRQNVALCPGTVVAFVPGEVHETRQIYSPGSYHVLMIPADALHARAARLGRTEVQLPLSPIHDAGIFRQFAKFCAHLERNESDTFVKELSYEALLETIVSLDVRAVVPSTAALDVLRQSEVIREVCDFLMRQPPSSKPSLAQVGRRLGLSPGYISRVFSSEGYCPPQTLMRLIRVERGRKLLQAGESVKGAAYQAGFSSPEKFHQHFRTVWNMAPSSYRSL